jgi:predicted aconitase
MAQQIGLLKYVTLDSILEHFTDDFESAFREEMDIITMGCPHTAYTLVTTYTLKQISNKIQGFQVAAMNFRLRLDDLDQDVYVAV